MDFNQIEAAVVAEGVHVRRFRSDALRGTMQGSGRTYSLYVYQDGPHLVLSFIPLTRLPEDKKKAQRLSAWCLLQNAGNSPSKLSVDEDGDVILSVEVLSRWITRRRLKRLMKILRRSADKLWLEMSKLV